MGTEKAALGIRQCGRSGLTVERPSRLVRLELGWLGICVFFWLFGGGLASGSPASEEIGGSDLFFLVGLFAPGVFVVEALVVAVVWAILRRTKSA